jgi:hypothetical protein
MEDRRPAGRHEREQRPGRSEEARVEADERDDEDPEQAVARRRQGAPDRSGPDGRHRDLVAGAPLPREP